PMARTVRDATLMLGVIAGWDAADATTSRRPVPDYLRGIDRGIPGLRIGIPTNYYFDDVDSEVVSAVREAARPLGALGARVSEVLVPDPVPLAEATGVVSRAESVTIHERLLRERPPEIQPVVRARLEFGAHIAAHQYLQALRARGRLAQEFLRAVFSHVDLLIAPTIPEPAPEIVAVTTGAVDDIIKKMGRFSRLTRPFNGLGLPALSLPCGFSSRGLPMALSIIGRPFDEATVLRAGQAYEQTAGWVSRRPALDCRRSPQSRAERCAPGRMIVEMSETRPIFEFSAGGLVVDVEGRVLLIRARDLRNRAGGTLPQGALAPGEQSADAALREVREEAGYLCEIARELEPVTYWFQRNGRRVKKTVQWFLMRPIEKVGEHDHEVDEVAWAAPAEALTRLRYDSDRRLV